MGNGRTAVGGGSPTQPNLASPRGRGGILAQQRPAWGVVPGLGASPRPQERFTTKAQRHREGKIAARSAIFAFSVPLRLCGESLQRVRSPETAGRWHQPFPVHPKRRQFHDPVQAVNALAPEAPVTKDFPAFTRLPCCRLRLLRPGRPSARRPSLRYCQNVMAPRSLSGRHLDRRGAVPWPFPRERPRRPAAACGAATRRWGMRHTPNARIAAN